MKRGFFWRDKSTKSGFVVQCGNQKACCSMFIVIKKRRKCHRFVSNHREGALSMKHSGLEQTIWQIRKNQNNCRVEVNWNYMTILILFTLGCGKRDDVDGDSRTSGQDGQAYCTTNMITSNLRKILVFLWNHFVKFKFWNRFKTNWGADPTFFLKPLDLHFQFCISQLSILYFPDWAILLSSQCWLLAETRNASNSDFPSSIH